jgi:hypothetical protein
MMGQQQETVASDALRRVILLWAVAAVVVSMMVASAMPTYAAGKGTDTSFSHACAKNNTHPSFCK